MEHLNAREKKIKNLPSPCTHCFMTRWLLDRKRRPRCRLRLGIAKSPRSDRTGTDLMQKSCSESLSLSQKRCQKQNKSQLMSRSAPPAPARACAVANCCVETVMGAFEGARGLACQCAMGCVVVDDSNNMRRFEVLGGVQRSLTGAERG